MKKSKFSAMLMAALIVLSGCGMNNTTKGGLIGGGAGAEQVQNAQVEGVKDSNGLDAVKVTFDSGILFSSGKSVLSATAMNNLKDFTNNVLKAYPDCDVAIQGYTDNTGFKGSTAEESFQKNIKLSQERADAVKSYMLAQGAAPSQIKSSTGFGENNPVAYQFNIWPRVQGYP